MLDSIFIYDHPHIYAKLMYVFDYTLELRF